MDPEPHTFMPNLGMTFPSAPVEARESFVGRRGYLVIVALPPSLFYTKPNKATMTSEPLFVINYFRELCNQSHLYPVADELLRRFRSYGT